MVKENLYSSVPEAEKYQTSVVYRDREEVRERDREGGERRGKGERQRSG